MSDSAMTPNDSPMGPRASHAGPYAWDALPIESEDNLDEDRWFQGYFKFEAGWGRDFAELLRREYAVAALGDVSGKRILDVACGSGLFMVPLAKLGAFVSGQDIDPVFIAEAQSNLARHNLTGELRLGDATRLQFDSDTFDAVISGDFLEHITLDQKRAFLSEVFRVLKPGGIFVAKTPNLEYLMASIWIQRISAILTGRSPFNIHIWHTRNNPDNEHHGLTTFGTLRDLLLQQMFLPPIFIRHRLGKRALGAFLQEMLPNLPLIWKYFNPDLIVAARKPVFYGLFR